MRRIVSINSLNTFLREANAHIHAPRTTTNASTPIAICIGNESLDLDSATSSIVRAFSLSSHAALTKPQQHHSFVVPVINVARDDFALRTEIAHLFGRVGLDMSALVFIDDPSLAPSTTTPTALRVHLVDHNRLAVEQEQLEGVVVSVVDHHKDEGRCMNAQSRRIVFPMGSCCTLVADELIGGVDGVVLDPPLATLLLGCILTDTSNLNLAMGKTEALDARMANELSVMANLDHAARTALYESISIAKNDIAKLNVRDLLRKDYKEFAMGGGKVGMSSMMTSASLLPNHENDGVAVKDALRLWMGERKLDILAVMTAFTREIDGKKSFQRELLLCAQTNNQRTAESLVSFLSSQPLLQLRPMSDPPFDDCKFYTRQFQC
jgi:exopolyphosphatase